MSSESAMRHGHGRQGLSHFRSLPLLRILEETHSSTSPETKLEDETLPPFAGGSQNESSRDKTPQEEHASTQPGRSMISGSALDPRAPPLNSSQSGLTPASPLEDLADRTALEEFVQRAFGLEPVSSGSQGGLHASEEDDPSTQNSEQTASSLKEALGQLDGGVSNDTETSDTRSRRANPIENTTREGRLAPETASGGGLDSFQSSAHQHNPEVQPRAESLGEGDVSEAQPSESPATNGTSNGTLNGTSDQE
ncbi:hypothetical protein N0V82_010239, partial [Gnomoniopsis sp. IMI 355080]